MKKIALIADDMWVIRSSRTLCGKLFSTTYYETPSTWNTAPSKATIFSSYEAAEGHMRMLRERDLKDCKGWADGSEEVFDLVPLATEIRHSPNAKAL
ncbi:MAG: hypothetical protein ACT4PZ_19400 [Panacagrimonas sp.]